MFYKIKIIAKDYTHIVSLFSIMLILVSFSLGNYNQHEVILTLIWICATFVLQISTSRLFATDYYNGMLEQFFIQPVSSRLIIVYKVFTHWLIFGLSISLISSTFSFIILGHCIKYAIAIGLSLLFNTLVIVSISATGNALTIGSSSVISQILVLPILMPTFVYFKLLLNNAVSIYIILATILIFIILIINSIMATHAALQLAVKQD
jgi:heme exporter protein B